MNLFWCCGRVSDPTLLFFILALDFSAAGGLAALYSRALATLPTFFFAMFFSGGVMLFLFFAAVRVCGAAHDRYSLAQVYSCSRPSIQFFHSCALALLALRMASELGMGNDTKKMGGFVLAWLAFQVTLNRHWSGLFDGSVTRLDDAHRRNGPPPQNDLPPPDNEGNEALILEGD